MKSFIISVRMAVILLSLVVLLPVISLFGLLVALITLGRASAFLTKWIGLALGKSVLFLAGIKIKEIHHDPEYKKQPAVFLFNHSSTLDLFITISLNLPKVRFIAKKEIAYNPFFWIMAKVTGQIMINRKDSRKAVEQIREAYDYVRENKISLMLAPEGTRSRDGKIKLFKSGAFRTAIDLGYPVRPVFIEGAYDLCPGSSLIFKPGTINVHFHHATDTSEWDKTRLRKHIEEVREQYLEWAGE
ncbi:lysophospholipid acyltransferase family protein [Balneolaceae bacterium ANBcel3]|nr:lysophospholipid acyltransferase family protein [Balneolaceae bacterium ANBcel3]